LNYTGESIARDARAVWSQLTAENRQFGSHLVDAVGEQSAGSNGDAGGIGRCPAVLYEEGVSEYRGNAARSHDAERIGGAAIRERCVAALEVGIRLQLAEDRPTRDPDAGVCAEEQLAGKIVAAVEHHDTAGVGIDLDRLGRAQCQGVARGRISPPDVAFDTD
jgi:hypothetical protein